MAVQNGVEGRSVAVMMAAGAKVRTPESIDFRLPPALSTTIQVEWEGRIVRMFLVDLIERGEELEAGSASA